MHSTSTANIKAFTMYFKEKFKPFQTDVIKAQQLLVCELRSLPIETNA